MNEMIWSAIVKLFTLVDGRLSQNFCKVFCVASIAGLVFSVVCLEGPYTLRAVFFGIVCLLMACFFGTMAAMYEEVIDCDEDSL